MARTMIAAAIPKHSVVVVDGESFTIDHISNGHPVAGRITWYDDDGQETEVGGAEEIEVVHAPQMLFEPPEGRRR
jgi:hypothetical protein